MRSPPFGVYRHGQPIERLKTNHSVETGIRIQPTATTRLGVVPEYEEREAARFGLYRWVDWVRLPLQERVQGIAHYRMHALIDLHSGDAHAEHAEREAAKHRRGPRIPGR